MYENGKEKISELEYDKSKNASTSNMKAHSTEELDAIEKIKSDFEDAKSARESDGDSSGDSLTWNVEKDWEDEYLLYKGGGLQWSTNFYRRSKRARQFRPNSEDNFIFNAITVQHANITADTPTVTISGVADDDDEVSEKLTDMSKFNDVKNKFPKMWKKLVFDFITSGPTIAKVTWDNDWIGGRGPDRWVGDVRVSRINKWDVFFDPAITDLEADLQCCSYIIHRPRKKIMYIRNKWENGKYVTEEENDDDLIDEGKNPRQTYLYEYWHRGFPWFVPADRKKELNEKAIELESQGDIYKANDYYDSAKGELEGIHVAYYCDNILLEYRPYEFEHGEYPFSYTTRYFDDKNPYGFGEIRNVKIPQIMHNKADEIEIEAVSRQGLGGARYQVGSVSPKQMERILENAGKGGVWEEVTNLSGIQERSGVQVPQSIVNYKEHKQRMIETISSNTPIQQGMSPGSSVPFATIQELGARSDVRMRAISNKLEDFLVSVNRQRLELFAQFYTEERYYRIKGSDGKTKEGSLKSDDMKKQWVREQRQTPVMKTNELGEEVEDIEIQETIETFVPEYDVSVSVVSEKPTDRNYYTNLAMQLYNMQLLTPEHFLETLDKGKLPATKEILEGVYVKNPMMEITNMLQQVPPELQQAIQQEFQTIMQEAMQALQGQEQAQENPQNGNPFAK